jgi:flagellar biosynthetic protein FliR
MILTIAQLEIFFFILARIIGVFIQAPLFNSRSFPAAAKIAFALWLSIVLWFVTPVSPILPTTVVGFILTLIAEVALGFIIGFICNVLFIALQSAGEMMDLQMGLSVAQALDPVFGAVISVIGRLIFFTALIAFITFDGHHLLLSALHQSFTALPAGKIANFATYNLTEQMLGLGSTLWMTAIKLAAPIILLIFLSDFTFGIVSRVAPQVNVFMLGFQVKPMLGLFGVLLTLPFLIKYVGKLIESMATEIIKLLAILK